MILTNAKVNPAACLTGQQATSISEQDIKGKRPQGKQNNSQYSAVCADRCRSGRWFNIALCMRSYFCIWMQGAFSHALAEYAMTAFTHFAKKIPTLQAQQKAHVWQLVSVEKLRSDVINTCCLFEQTIAQDLKAR